MNQNGDEEGKSFTLGPSLDQTIALSIWLALSILNVVLISNYASPYPISDDWLHLYRAGSLDGMTLTWLIEPIAGFFKPITYSLTLLTYKFLGGDHRPALIVMFLPAVALSLVATLAVVRSQSEFKLLAVAIPLSLLNLSFFGTISWHTAAYCTLQTACIVWAITKFYRSQNLARPAITCCILTSLSALQGIMTTVMLAPFVIVAILETAFPAFGDTAEKGKPRTIAAVLTLIWVCSTALTFLYAISASGIKKESGAALGDALTTYFQFISMSFGIVNRKIWPFGCVAILLALTIFAFVNILRLYRGTTSVRESLRDVACIAPIPLIGVLIALQRSHQGALIDRYACYTVPLFVGLFFVMLKYAESNRVAKLTLYSLFLIPVSSFWFDCQKGIADARIRQEGFRSMQAQLKKGSTIEEMFAQHEFANQNFHWAVPAAKILSQVSGSDWQNLSHADYEQQELRLDELTAHGLSLIGGAWTPDKKSKNCYLSLEFPAQFVDLVWIDYMLESKTNSMPLTIKWKNTNDSVFETRSTTRHVNFNSAEKSRTGESLPLIVHDWASQLAIYPGNGNFRFHVTKITLLRKKIPEGQTNTAN